MKDRAFLEDLRRRLARIQKEQGRLHRQQGELEKRRQAILLLIASYSRNGKQHVATPQVGLRAIPPAQDQTPGGNHGKVLEIALEIRKTTGQPIKTADVIKQVIEKGVRFGGRTDESAIIAGILHREATRKTAGKLKKIGRGLYDIVQ